MPWEDRKVRQLFRAIDEAKAVGSEVRVRGSLLSLGVYENAPFYVPPQKPLPPKEFVPMGRGLIEDPAKSPLDKTKPEATKGQGT